MAEFIIYFVFGVVTLFIGAAVFYPGEARLGVVISCFISGILFCLAFQQIPVTITFNSWN